MILHEYEILLDIGVFDVFAAIRLEVEFDHVEEVCVEDVEYFESLVSWGDCDESFM
jgi:hypothetical protein